jgi:hypothetical protein
MIMTVLQTASEEEKAYSDHAWVRKSGSDLVYPLGATYFHVWKCEGSFTRVLPKEKPSYRGKRQLWKWEIGDKNISKLANAVVYARNGTSQPL